MKKIILLMIMSVTVFNISYGHTLTKSVLSANVDTQIDEGSKVTITYNEIPGYDFVDWTVTGVALFDSTNTQQIINMPGNDVTLKANLELTTYTINYNLGSGTVSGNPTSYKISTNTITLNNPTKEGYVFLGWTGSNGVVPQKTVTIPKGSTGNKVFTAHWGISQYLVTVTSNVGGIVTPGTKTVNHGDNITFTITANTGYEIDKVKLNGTNQTVSNRSQMNYTLSNITEDKTLIITFNPIDYVISYTLNGGNVTGNPTIYTIETDAITLKNPTKSGAVFSGWIGSCGTLPQKNVVIPKGSIGNRTYAAQFENTE